MAGNNVDISGLEEGLKRMARDNIRARDKALKKGAEHIRDRLQRNTPISSKGRPGHKHMKDFTVHTEVSSEGEVRIGFSKDVNYRAHFVELGTVYQRPQAFMKRTQVETKQDFFDIVAEELRRELGL